MDLTTQGSYFSDNKNVAAITGPGFISLVAPGETSVVTTLDYLGVDANCFVCPPEGGCTYQWASNFNPVQARQFLERSRDNSATWYVWFDNTYVTQKAK